MTNKEFSEFKTLIIKAQEGMLSEEEKALLNELMKSPENQKLYFELIKVNCALQHLDQTEFERIKASGGNSEYNMNLLKQLANYEHSAPEVDIPAPAPEPEQSEEPIAYKPKHEKRKLSKISLFIYSNTAAAILILLLLSYFPTKGHKRVAVLQDSLNAQWSSSTGKLVNGSEFATSDEVIVLREGYAELLFDNQVKITIEGPTEFKIVADDQIKLNHGRIYATVPREAIGFTIKTDSAKIVDLGTEFGVDCSLRKDTSLHVIKGKTVLIAGDKSSKTSIEVKHGDAKKVVGSSQTIADIPCNDRLFARHINSTENLVWRGQTEINLADIVGGGNGFGSGRLDSGIDTNTGRRFLKPDGKLVQGKSTGITVGKNIYNRVNELAFIDGVFVPFGRDGSVQITSEGDYYDGFVEGGDTFWGYIFNGAWHASETTVKHNLMLDGQAYGTVNNPAIAMHSNQGITFDLQTIREMIPKGKILRFTSLFGVSETVTKSPSFTLGTDGPNMGHVNCWVLIDGKERFNQKGLTCLNGEINLTIDIQDSDRFLTLVVTESNDRRSCDWALFAKPSLQIEMDIR